MALLSHNFMNRGWFQKIYLQSVDATISLKNCTKQGFSKKVAIFKCWFQEGCHISTSFYVSFYLLAWRLRLILMVWLELIVEVNWIERLFMEIALIWDWLSSIISPASAFWLIPNVAILWGLASSGEMIWYLCGKEDLRRIWAKYEHHI